jgi:squalene-hopene cyclase
MTDAASATGPTGPTGKSLLVPAPSRARVDAAVAAARDWLIARQRPEGFWQGELEGDTTLESYLILIEAFFNRRQSDKVHDLARVIRAEALPEGGWNQYLDGPPELSVSCLSYFALKVAGESAEAPHMRAARATIAALGGIARANTYTRHHLAMFGQVSWESVPAIPPEMLFFPRRAPFSVYDLSAWSRTIFVPLSIIWAEKPVVALPAACGVGELLEDAAALGPVEPPPAADWKTVFHGIDKLLKVGERVPGAGLLRRRAVKRAGAWMIERLAESEGLSAILPAMANSALALSLLGYSEKHPLLAEALGHIDGLLLRDEEGLRMQPCLSPVWDTVLAAHALLQGAVAPDDPAVARAVAWLLGKQTQRPGDWAVRNPVPPGGWYFEGKNEFYPDVDDTCMALMVLAQARAGGTPEARAEATRRGLDWMMGMQNDDGGWASFDRGNDKHWLTAVPFADHNAMIDPSTADITARVLECSVTCPVTCPIWGSPTRRSPARSGFFVATRPPRGAGTAAGGSTTFTAPGRCCAGWPRSARTCRRPMSGAPRAGCSAGRTTTVAGARASPATTTRGKRGLAPRRPARRPGRSWVSSPPARPPAWLSGGASCTSSSGSCRMAPGSSASGPGPASRRSFISTIIITGTTSR